MDKSTSLKSGEWITTSRRQNPYSVKKSGQKQLKNIKKTTNSLPERNPLYFPASKEKSALKQSKLKTFFRIADYCKNEDSCDETRLNKTNSDVSIELDNSSDDEVFGDENGSELENMLCLSSKNRNARAIKDASFATKYLIEKEGNVTKKQRRSSCGHKDSSLTEYVNCGDEDGGPSTKDEPSLESLENAEPPAKRSQEPINSLFTKNMSCTSVPFRFCDAAPETSTQNAHLRMLDSYDEDIGHAIGILTSDSINKTPKFDNDDNFISSQEISSIESSEDFANELCKRREHENVTEILENCEYSKRTEDTDLPDSENICLKDDLCLSDVEESYPTQEVGPDSNCSSYDYDTDTLSLLPFPSPVKPIKHT